MYISKKITLFLLMFASLSAFGNQENARPHCVSKEACLNDPNCLCWCSQICNWRKKTELDHPVYIENDPYGKFCYCKKWDFDHYEDNCIYHRNIKQAPGAK